MGIELPPPLDQVRLLCERGELVAAETICRQVLQRDPQDAEALHLLGLVALQKDDAESAVRLIGEAVAIAPSEPKFRTNLSAVLGLAGRQEEALEAAREAVALHPDFPEAHNGLGSALVRVGQCEEALGSYLRAIGLRTDYDEAFYNRGVAQQRLGRHEAAVFCFGQATALQPDYVEAYNALGVSLAGLYRFDEALASYEQAIELDPEYDEAFYNRGAALQDMERYEEAIASYDRALAIRPDYAEALRNRGMAAQALGRYGEALDDFDRSIALRPDHAPTHHGRSSCLLRSGDFERGWKAFEWRWGLPELQAGLRHFAQPLWGGEPIEGKTILLHAEQGLGDTLQFCRFVPLVAARGARVILEVQRPLARLVGTLPGAAETIVRGDDLPPFDLHCPLMSLSLAFGTTLESIPAAPYLAADPDFAGHWLPRIEAIPGLRVGVVWAGQPGLKRDHQRSMPLDRLAPLAAVPGVSLVSLQKGAGTRQARDPSAPPMYDYRLHR
jgi:tetratricopeptide (TPR) repeat protein